MIKSEAYTRKHEEKLNFIVYTPSRVKDSLPLIVFLHGAGERGTNLEHLYRHGIPKLIKEGADLISNLLNSKREDFTPVRETFSEYF